MVEIRASSGSDTMLNLESFCLRGAVGVGANLVGEADPALRHDLVEGVDGQPRVGGRLAFQARADLAAHRRGWRHVAQLLGAAAARLRYVAAGDVGHAGPDVADHVAACDRRGPTGRHREQQEEKERRDERGAAGGGGGGHVIAWLIDLEGVWWWDEWLVWVLIMKGPGRGLYRNGCVGVRVCNFALHACMCYWGGWRIGKVVQVLQDLVIYSLWLKPLINSFIN